MSIYKRCNKESFEEYFERLCSDFKTYGGWTKLGNALNTITGNDFSPDYWRHCYTKMKNPSAPYSYLRDDIDFIMDDIYEHSTKNEKLQRENQILKIQLRDERMAWNKQNYLAARLEETLDIMEEKFSEIGKTDFKPVKVSSCNGDNDLLVILSDFHIGQTFNNMFGSYNTDIAEKRLKQLLSEVIEIGKTHNSEKCYISLQGDLISGSIHKSIQVTNRENVIDQIKIATGLIANFVYECTKYFKKVFLSSVVGNHTRIDKKEDAIHDERLDDIIPWSINLILHQIDNFHLLNRNIDIGIADINIRGKSYIAVHGDYDAFCKSGVSNLVTMLGFSPYAVTMGHMHTCAIDEVNGIKMIRGGNLAGSGDQYTIEKRLTGKPSQMVCVCTEKGVKAFYPIELD